MAELGSVALKILAGAFSLGSLGHLIRTCRAAAFLAERGHEVLFLSAERSLPVVREYGLRAQAVPELTPSQNRREIKTDADVWALAKSRIASPDYLRWCAEAEARILDTFRPDVVLASSRHTLCVLAKERAVPVVNLMNVKHLASPMPIVFPCLLESLQEAGFSEVAARGVFGDVLAIPGFASYEPISDTDPGLWALIRPNVREIRYLGPFAPDGFESMQSGEEATQRRSIYVSLGGAATVGRDLPALLEKLRGRSERFVVHTGEHVSAEQASAALLRPLGPSLYCFTFARHNFELLRSCQAAIIHGGHGSVYESLFAGIPTLILPALKEQRDNGGILARLGAGIIESADAPAARLNHALDVLLAEPRFGAAASSAAAGVHSRNGLPELARLVESRVL